MVLDSQLKKLFEILHNRDHAQIRLMGSDICVGTDHHSAVSMRTEVYFGGNFIPQSVRRCIHSKPFFDRNVIDTTLTIDEENFKIFLKYNGTIQSLNHRTFIDALEEFSFLAEEWKLFIDEHDKNDLVYTRVK